ncbi:hypothetical protein [Shimia sp. Alg240-R146]|uniref:hypothetical protein n=1 Tax=Shimia sp. Alg240-R146 TaxID=2993449 RepID=UPI0022E2E31F|nr:hypothetical protein [Shimia sp. Alg240-R146]
MLRFAPFRTTTAVLAFLPATWAHADVTAQDVWTNLQAYGAAVGGTLSAELVDTADGPTLTNLTYGLALDMPATEAGDSPTPLFDATVTLPDMALQNRADGTVTIAYPDTTTQTISVTMAEGTAFEIPFAMETKGFIATASGMPGDITYDYSATEMAYSSVFAVPSEFAAAFDGATDFDMQINYKDVLGKVTITEGDLIKIRSDARIGKTHTLTKTGHASDSPAKATSDNSTTGQHITGTMDLPASGITFFDMSQALRAGLNFAMTLRSESFAQTETVAMGEDLISETQLTSGPENIDMTVNTAGLLMDATASDTSLSVSMPAAMPVPMRFEANEVSIGLRVPLLTSDAPSGFAFKTQFKDVTVGDEIWGMFDPNSQLPRDPAQLAIDLSGTLIHKVEWLNFLAVPDAIDALTSLPVEPHDLLINALSIDAAGAKASAKGALTFDLSDLQTYDGMPRPDGQISVDVQGLNGLLDALIAIGLLPENQAMGVRMMLGGFAKSVGEDHLTSTIEMTPSGQILANGQRLK